MLILATEVERHDIVEVLKCGAAGIVLKESTTQLLRKSIHAVVAGEYWVERQNISDLVQGIDEASRPRLPGCAERALAFDASRTADCRGGGCGQDK